MAEVNETKAEVTEAKQKSKTERYKEHLQKIVYQQLGMKVSKDKAWNLFKAIQHGTVEFVVNLPAEEGTVGEGTGEEGRTRERTLPLAGVGTFKILETKPRGSKAGLDKEGKPIEGATAWPCVPRFRFYPSSKVDQYIEWKYGLGDHTDVKEEHYGIFAPDLEPEKPAKATKKAKKSKTEKKAEAAAMNEPEAPAEADAFDDL